MQRCARIVRAAACCCAVRRLRQAGATRHAIVAAQRWPVEAAVCVPLLTSTRRQSTTPDKRFHCSVCKKAFRLEMAAKLHLQQVHGGDGTVEAGAGPGQSSEQATPAPVGVFRNAPPQAPTVVTAVQPDAHERPARREKPAPKPLHQAEREVPSLVMEKMLSVWDDMGLKRMGNQFVHSSMVMRVFAARPSESEEPLYGIIPQEGENPFAGIGDAAAAVGSRDDFVEAEESRVYRLNPSDAFAMATADAVGPCRPARCLNPFRMKYTREISATVATVDAAEEQKAPVTPFGQLPVFGQTAPSQPPPAADTMASPAATDAADGAESSGPLVSSPFAAGVADSPFAGTATTPFADAAYSPFAAAAGAEAEAGAPPASTTASADIHTNTAAAAIPSPFASAAAPSPFAASPFISADGAASVSDFANANAAFDYAAAAAAPAVAAAAAVTKAPPAHVCSLCEKSFSTHDGLRMHSKAKHGVDLPKQVEPKKKSVPDLPAYIPSPVDLSMTSPFGSSSQTGSWKEVKLTPYAQSMSNITIAGMVVDVIVSRDSSVLMTVCVRDPSGSWDEMISLRCSAEAMRAVRGPFRRGEAVFACGTLRLLPVTEQGVKGVFASPVVHVTSPTGVIARLNAS